MKKYLKIGAAIIFIGILCFFGYQIISKIKHKNQIANNIKTIPTFTFQDLNGLVFSNQNLKNNTPTVFIYFNTGCEFCQGETIMIKENIRKLNGVQIIFISFEKPEIIKKFALKYKLLHHDNISFLCDSKISFSTIFDVKSLPCLVLYDRNQKLIEKIKGQTKAETLLKKLKL